MDKIWRSPYSDFSNYVLETPDCDLKDETITALDVYTDQVLDGIREAGFNAIWVHGILRHLVNVEPFPELGKNADRQINALRCLTERASRHGMKVFIHLQPPRAVPISFEEFWNNHPDVGGQEEIALGECAVPVKALCTSTAPVKQWLTNAMAKLAADLPLLGGVTVITSSEFHSHCYSRRNKENSKRWRPLIECQRCREREPEEVAAEIIALLTQGARRVSPQFRVIAWNWSWGWRPDSNAKVINLLPPDAIVMADFERGGVKDIPGRKAHLYDEYSLSYSGPSERFMESYLIAQKRGMRVMAKLQLGTTHELASVVSLPLLGSLFDKANFIKRHQLAGFMGCWNFGNQLSANTAGFNYFLSDESPIHRDEALEKFAADYFPGCDASLMRLVWQTFGKAMEYFPFSIAFLYHGAHSHTLAYAEMYRPAPLSGEPAGRSWQPDERGDELANSYQLDHHEFTLDDLIERLGNVADVWQSGLCQMQEALRNISGDHAEEEIGNAIICGAVWRSTENTYKIYRLRQNWNDSLKEQFLQIAEDELAILGEVLPFVERDARQGFHAEPQFYMFNADKIRAKREVLKVLLSQRRSDDKMSQVARQI